MILIHAPNDKYTHVLYREYICVLNKQQLYCGNSLEDTLAAGRRTFGFSEELCDEVRIAYTKVALLNRVIINTEHITAWASVDDGVQGIIIKFHPEDYEK